MAEGAEVSCLVDAWIKEMIDARLGTGEDQTEEDRKVLVREFSDHEIAMVVLSFLLASQDAMTSAAVSTLYFLLFGFRWSCRRSWSWAEERRGNDATSEN